MNTNFERKILQRSCKFVKKKIKGAIELKKGKMELKHGSICGLKKIVAQTRLVAQTRQCDQSRNQKRLKVWLKKLLAMLKS